MVVTVGAINAGAKHNIISNEAKLLLLVRSYDDVRKMLLGTIKRIALGQAAPFGIPEPIVKYESDFTPSTFNDHEHAERFMGAVAKKIGKRNIKETPPVMGGKDFSRYHRTSQKIPSLIFWLGVVKPATYKKGYYKVSYGNTDLGEKAFLVDFKIFLESYCRGLLSR